MWLLLHLAGSNVDSLGPGDAKAFSVSNQQATMFFSFWLEIKYREGRLIVRLQFTTNYQVDHV